MIETILFLLKTVESDSKTVLIAKGLHKYPETWSELKRYLKYRYNHKYR